MSYFVEWDTLPDFVQSELEKMHVIAKGGAEKRLENYGFFLPFGLIFTKNKELMVLENGNKDMASHDALKKVYNAIMEKKESLIMAAVVSNINIKNNSIFKDGISIDLHHSYGTAAKVIIPYIMRGIFKKKPQCADFLREPYDEPFIWSPH